MAADFTDRSGTITNGGQDQQLLAVNDDRRAWSIQNLSTSDLWFNDTGGSATAGAGSNRVPPGALYESVENFATSKAVRIFGAVTGQAFSCKEC